MLAQGEDVQAELVSEHRIAQNLVHAVHRPVRPAGALITLQISQRQDA